MRAVAKAAGTTTPTVYERYHDRDDIVESFATQDSKRALLRPHSDSNPARGDPERLELALEHTHAYEVLFDGVGKPPSLHEPWPSFNLMRERLAKQLGGDPRRLNRIILAIWSLMHGTAMLIIRGGFEGALRTQAVHACLDTVESIIRSASRIRGFVQTGPKWPSNLILGEAEHSSLGNDVAGNAKRKSKARILGQ